MSKRTASDETTPIGALKNHSRDPAGEDGLSSNHPPEMGEFEDTYEDEFSSDDEIVEAGADGEHPASDDEDGGMDVDEQVYMPSRRKLGKDEILEPDPSVYHMLHSVNVNWPCLSFDILPDELGEERRGFPQTVYLAAGTQAARAKENEVLVMKLSGLSKMPHQNPEDEEDDDEDDASDTEDDPILETRSLPCPSTTNRIRVSPHSHTAASLAESGDVYIWDLAPHYASLTTPGTSVPPAANKPTATLKMHRREEGYAIDWCPHQREQLGKIATGDGTGNIFVSTRSEAGNWTTGATPFTGHTGSVEEIQWSPAQRHVFASASSDGTVKVWDARAKEHRPQLSVEVSSSDVNVASWSRTVDHLLATGADDGVWGVWDMRTWGSGKHIAAAASFTFHQEPITSIEFHPTEESTVVVASADSTVTLWDLGVELDDEESKDTGGVDDVPPQLLFVHYMKDVKEARWQKQAPGVVVGTGGDGFNVFKTISVY